MYGLKDFTTSKIIGTCIQQPGNVFRRAFSRSKKTSRSPIKPASFGRICGVDTENGRYLRYAAASSILLLCFIAGPLPGFSQVAGTARDTTKFSPKKIKKLSIEQLMDIEVTSVSKTPEKLSEVASAIQVITNEDIRRSAYFSLPAALRLATNLQVGQTNAHDWSISARGFNAAPSSNGTLADKLLVMIDGRTVYNPLFGGVFWDIQNVLTEDIDRVEVVSGPGGTLWGANAVNGVINVISKSAKETQGVYASGAAGSFLKDYGAVRYGGHAGQNLFFRVYVQSFAEGNTRINGKDARDDWNMTQGGFRIDYLPSAKTTLTVQGDVYKGKENDSTLNSMNGENIMARLSHIISPTSNYSLQAYYDRTWRSLTYVDYATQLNTFDVDFQHYFNIGTRNRILWGTGVRAMADDEKNSPALAFVPADRELILINSFVQDQVSLIPKKIDLTVGTKVLKDTYTGYQLQPSVRVAWTPGLKNTIWAAVSRAVRTPSRIETDENVPGLSTPGGRFLSEKVVAYEVGYRVRPVDRLSLSIATYYNMYSDLRSINNNPNPPTTLIFANDQKATGWGLELSGKLVVNDWWRLRGGYTYANKTIKPTANNVLSVSGLFEALDPRNQAMFQSVMELPGHLQFDMSGRYVDKIDGYSPDTNVPPYFAVDARLAWEYRQFSLAVVGKDLTDEGHREFGANQIPRSAYFKLTLRF